MYDQGSETIGREFKIPLLISNMGLNPNQAHRGIQLPTQYCKKSTQF